MADRLTITFSGKVDFSTLRSRRNVNEYVRHIEANINFPAEHKEVVMEDGNTYVITNVKKFFHLVTTSPLIVTVTRGVSSFLFNIQSVLTLTDELDTITIEFAPSDPTATAHVKYILN